MNVTVIFIISLILAVAIFDVVVIMKKGKDDSISAHMIRWSREFPMFTLGIGILIGHLFWSMNTFDWATPEQIKEKCQTYLEENK